jgi:hypothetical protein
MSLNPLVELAPILPDLKQNWTDLNKDGRRMDQIIRKCMTEFKKEEDMYERRLAFLDRLLKATQTKERLAITVLGVRTVLEEAKKR